MFQFHALKFMNIKKWSYNYDITQGLMDIMTGEWDAIVVRYNYGETRYNRE